MKRSLTILFTAAMVLSLSACGNNQNDKPSASDSQPPAQTQSVPNSQTPVTDDTASKENGSDSGSKILIAYFTAAENSGVDAISSASYTTVNGTPVGRVRAVADMIAEETGGELFSIQTSVVYPTDGEKLIDYAAKEQDENARPELTSKIDNLDQYDTIFIGYPNWWYDLPMVMYSFFDEYDFAGKTIIPFNVHNGSRFSSTIETIQKMEPQAAVVEDGFTVSERTVADAAEDVASWLDGLGY
ncbi:flavodoxin [Clostridium sp. KNHs205]|uniref:flavodoxin n=1 Tax=Clostridium sp. KNHs205 TaxID=1449050 RepID=UPI000A64B1A6|nr:flavodoxin [Clostridium sp. KNHs205]